MVDSKPSNTGAAPKRPEDHEVEEQLRYSRQVRAEAEVKIRQAEETASEMSKVLRRLAAAIDRNPQTWDSLLLDDGKDR